MTNRLGRLAMLLVLATAAGCRAQPSATVRAAPLALERTIALKGVGGRIDHLAIDAEHQRLFVAELGAGSVEAIDLAHGTSLGRIGGLKEPQGLAYLPARDELAVASGEDGSVRFYHAADLSPVGVVEVGGDADNLRIDATGRVVVGFGAGGLAVIDPASLTIVSRLTLTAHPEGFQLDGGRVFVNLPDGGRIVAGDLAGRRKALAWPVAYRWNFPMALDSASHVLAVVYRFPARLQLLDAASGAVKLDRSTCGDADDAFFDPPRRRLYVICGAGAVDVVDLARPNQSVRIRTRAGARTGLFAPQLDRLVVAARAGEHDDAALLVFKPNP